VYYAEIVRAVSPIWLQVRRTSRHGSVRPSATSWDDLGRSSYEPRAMDLRSLKL